MFIEINDEASLRQVQDKFSSYYPYLKVEFSGKPQKEHETFENGGLSYEDLVISEIEKRHLSALLEIQPWHKVATIVKEFQYRFGWPIQVLWKENENWRPSSGMDDFTLRELNELGRNSSGEFIISGYEAGFEQNEEE